MRFRGVPLSDVGLEDLSSMLVRSAANRETLKVSFVNPHSFNLLHDDVAGTFSRDLERLDVVIPDGIGVVAACRVLRLGQLPRYGFDLLAPVVFEALDSGGVPVYLLGGEPGRVDRVAIELHRSTPGLRIVGTHHGFLDDAQDLESQTALIDASGAGLVCVGMGAPKQERWVVALSDALPGRVFVTTGGYFDQVLWTKTYYPAWAHRLGLNWLVRLFREPVRLWRRYSYGSIKYVFHTLKWAVSGRPDSQYPLGSGSGRGPWSAE